MKTKQPFVHIHISTRTLGQPESCWPLQLFISMLERHTDTSQWSEHFPCFHLHRNDGQTHIKHSQTIRSLLRSSSLKLINSIENSMKFIIKRNWPRIHMLYVTMLQCYITFIWPFAIFSSDIRRYEGLTPRYSLTIFAPWFWSPGYNFFCPLNIFFNIFMSA